MESTATTTTAADNDLTNASILEFLNQEQNCQDADNMSELDVESLFEEINRLSDNADERSVEEILREADFLMNNSYEMINSSSSVASCSVKDSLSTSGSDTAEAIPQKTDAGKDTKSNSASKNIEKELCNGIKPSAAVRAQPKPKQMQPKRRTSANFSPKQFNHVLDYPSRPSSAAASFFVKRQNSCDKISDKENFSSQKHMSESVRNSFSHTPVNKTPPHSPVSRASSSLSPQPQFSWTRERNLEKEIEDLQEKLKDTEERFQSLRLQHDSLSEGHRVLKENSTQFQEETDRFKSEVQHLSECANVLRTELQNARADRTEALELQKSIQTELNESRSEKKNLLVQTEKDAKTIQDLQRQCREMERILMRKHPDSVSALIVASKNSNNQSDDNSQSRRLLEQRISQLESDAREQDYKAQKILANVQAKFSTVQSKYETHIADLETQVLSLQEINSKLNEKLTTRIEEIERYRHKQSTYSISSQTDDVPEKESTAKRTVASQTETKTANATTKLPVINSVKKQGKLTNSYSETTISQHSAKEDAHLLATLRGMRVDLAIKEKAMQRLTREVEECKKTIRKLQKERDTYLKNEKPGSNGLARKPYDPSQFAESSSDGAGPMGLKEAQNKIKMLESDYKSLHDKRMQDLKTLQAAHERELASCHETVKVLQQRLSDREETVAIQKRRRLPIDYYSLKAKVTSLERRHSEREERLHMLVEALSKGRLNSELEQVINDNTNYRQNNVVN